LRDADMVKALDQAIGLSEVGSDTIRRRTRCIDVDLQIEYSSSRAGSRVIFSRPAASSESASRYGVLARGLISDTGRRTLRCAGFFVR